MLFIQFWFLLLTIFTAQRTLGQLYSQQSNRWNYNTGKNYVPYGNNRNLNSYKLNYNENIDRSIVRLPDIALRPGELIAEVNDSQGQTPCRNKEKNKDRKDTLWWTLPIPPMELEGTPEKAPQVKAEQPTAERQQSPSSGGGVETGAIQQKHGAPAGATTAKPQPPAPATQGVVQVATTQAGKHEATTVSSKQADKQKIAQMQKQQQSAAAQQQAAPAVGSGGAAVQAAQQPSAPAPTQLVVSNKEPNVQMLANKSVATMRAPNSNRGGAAMPHPSNKQKVNFNPMGYQKLADTMAQGYVNYPYLNGGGYLREPLVPAYRPRLEDSIAQLADNMYREFDSNEAELGGGALVGDNSYLQNGPGMVHYENPFAYPKSDQWNGLAKDDRNKRTLNGAPVIS